MRFSFAVLLGAAFAGVRQGQVDDSSTLLQVRQHSNLESIATALQQVLTREDMQKSLADTIAGRPPPFPDQASLMQFNTTRQQPLAGNSAGARNLAPRADPAALDEALSMLLADMRGDGGQPDPRDVAALLQTAAAKSRANVSHDVPAEAVMKDWAKARQLFSRDEAAHQHVVDMARKLHHLLSDAELFESLRTAAGHLKEKKQPLFDPDQVPIMERSASEAMQRLGLSLLDKGELESSGGRPTAETFKWKPYLYDPYIRFAFHLGPKVRCAKGIVITFTFGVKNHFYISLLEQNKGWSVLTNKYVFRVGVYHATDNGDYFGGQLQADWEWFLPQKTGEGNRCWGKFKQMALTFRYQPIDPKVQDKNGTCKAYYHHSSQLGWGMQKNRVSAVRRVKDGWLDHLAAFDYDAAKTDKDWKGWTYSTVDRLGVDTHNPNFFSKVFLFSKMRVLPRSRARLPDIRFRVFGRPTCSR